MATDEPSLTPGPTTQIRLSRGAIAMGTDGVIGTLHQIIMDQHTGELQALVILTDSGQRLELSATHVLRATADAVDTDVSIADLRAHPELAKLYNPDKYVPVQEDRVVDPSAASDTHHPVVTNIEHDAVGVAVPTDDSVTPAEPEVTVAEAAPTTPQPEPVLPPGAALAPAASATAVPASTASETATTPDEIRSSGPFPPSSLTPTAPLIDRVDEAGATVDSVDSVATSDADSTPTTPAMATITQDMTSGAGDESGLEYATATPDSGTPLVEEEAAYMEGSEPTVNPVNPGVASDTIYNDESTVPDTLDESQHAYTHSTPPEAAATRPWMRRGLTSSSNQDIGNQLTWVPAAALGALIVGVAVWSTMRAIRRGRRKAAETAQSARLSAEALRASVRDSVRDASKSAVGLAQNVRTSAQGMAQTVRASAQEMAANPRDTATDAFSRFADIPARYRWFRRGIRVGMQIGRMRRS